MRIICDSREQKWDHVKAEFDRQGIPWIRSKLPVGDYARMDNMTVCVDRKQHLGEVESNLIQQHDRFRAECIKALDNGIRLIVLVEHGPSVKTLEDVAKWQNPRLKRWLRIKAAHERGMMLSIKTPARPPIAGDRLAAIMQTMADKYGVEWRFCPHQAAGREIIKILQEVPSATPNAVNAH